MIQSYKFTHICLTLFTAAFISSCSGQSNSNTENNNANSIINKTKVDKIDELISLYSENAGFNGSVLIAHEGEIIYKKGFGLANMEWNIPNQEDTKFRIASVTKPFTAMLIMQLVAENKIVLHKPITTYLKDYPKENGDQITIHHLLTHSSGLIRDVETEQKLFHKPKELVDLFANEPLQFSPGARFDYSNTGYILLGHIIETITGKSYKEMLEEKIFKPLNMKNSGYYRHRLLLENRSSGYSNHFVDYNNANYRDFSNAYSAGSIYSTVEDMFLFDQALYTVALLPQKYLDLGFTKHIEDNNNGGFYGYGWEVIEKPIGNTSERVKAISHGGSLPGYCAVFTRIPSSKTSIILLNNTGRAFLNAITTAITGILYNKPYDLPNKSVAKSLLDIVDKEGINQGIQFYNKAKDDNGYYLNEEEMNIVSYKLLQSNRAEAAAEVLQLAITSFPEAFNLYDSFGEVLLNLGKKEKSIENYKKSVELNPNNKNGLKVLKELGIEH